MRELREDTFSGGEQERGYARSHLMGGPQHRSTKKKNGLEDVFPRILSITLDSFKKAFIQQYCPPSMTAKQLEDIHNFKQDRDESLYQAWERTTNRQLLDSHGPIPGMRPAEALTAIQTMADHSQKWHDDTSGNIGWMPNLRRTSPRQGLSPQRGSETSGRGPPGYYTKIDNRPPYAERRQSLEELLTKHQEESARRSTEMEVWIKKLQENAEINTRNQDASLKNLETQIDQLTGELRSRKEKSKQAKVVTVENEGPSSPKQLKNLHGISFLFDSLEENTNDQLPTKEANPGHFTLPCTIGNFNFYDMADLGASVDVLPRNIFEYLELMNLSETKMLVEMADMRKKAPLGIVRDILVKIDKFLFPSDFVILDQTPNSTVILGRPFLATAHAQINVFEKEISVGIGDERVEDSVWSNMYSEWCNENFQDKKPRPRDYTFNGWVKPKKWHLNINLDEDPFGRCLDEYNWVFHKEIKQLADEYEIKIREKGQVLEEIWAKCKRARSKDKDWWYDYWYEDEEKAELVS
ncbi:reverse transcriptase domain-containing protein [Tanacetum coccineum]